jgi:hypothetical protein
MAPSGYSFSTIGPTGVAAASAGIMMPFQFSRGEAFWIRRRKVGARTKTAMSGFSLPLKTLSNLLATSQHGYSAGNNKI